MAGPSPGAAPAGGGVVVTSEPLRYSREPSPKLPGKGSGQLEGKPSGLLEANPLWASQEAPPAELLRVGRPPQIQIVLGNRVQMLTLLQQKCDA